jgi:hypothetical protein
MKKTKLIYLCLPFLLSSCSFLKQLFGVSSQYHDDSTLFKGQYEVVEKTNFEHDNAKIIATTETKKPGVGYFSRVRDDKESNPKYGTVYFFNFDLEFIDFSKYKICIDIASLGHLISLETTNVEGKEYYTHIFLKGRKERTSYLEYEKFYSEKNIEFTDYNDEDKINLEKAKFKFIK